MQLQGLQSQGRRANSQQLFVDQLLSVTKHQCEMLTAKNEEQQRYLEKMLADLKEQQKQNLEMLKQREEMLQLGECSRSQTAERMIQSISNSFKEPVENFIKDSQKQTKALCAMTTTPRKT